MEKSKPVYLPSMFSGLGKDHQQILTLSGIRKTYLPGQVLVAQGEYWPYLFMIEEGEIAVKKESNEGRLFIASTLVPGDVFWGISFFTDDAPSPVVMEACLKTTAVLWDRESMMPAIQKNAPLAWNLCQIMVRRMLLASEIVEDLAFQPVMARLAALMLDTFGEVENEYVARSLTLEDMAARIGTTREVVCRYLYKFAEQGAIEIKRTELKMTDKEFLEQQTGKN